jgi:hypothetical protein
MLLEIHFFHHHLPVPPLLLGHIRYKLLILCAGFSGSYISGYKDIPMLCSPSKSTEVLQEHVASIFRVEE